MAVDQRLRNGPRSETPEDLAERARQIAVKPAAAMKIDNSRTGFLAARSVQAVPSAPVDERPG